MKLEKHFSIQLYKPQRDYLERVKAETGQTFNATIRALINAEIKREKKDA